MHPKDKIDKLEKAGVVYHIQCGECEMTYVDQQFSISAKQHRAVILLIQVSEKWNMLFFLYRDQTRKLQHRR